MLPVSRSCPPTDEYSLFPHLRRHRREFSASLRNPLCGNDIFERLRMTEEVRGRARSASTSFSAACWSAPLPRSAFARLLQRAGAFAVVFCPARTCDTRLMHVFLLFVVSAVAVTLSATDARAQQSDAVRRARDCGVGPSYNECVLRVLDGDRSARGLMMKIEANRNLNRDADRVQAIRDFIERYPDHPRAARYARELPAARRRPRGRATSPMADRITRIERDEVPAPRRTATQADMRQGSAVSRAQRCGTAEPRAYYRCVLRELRGARSASALMMQIEAHRGLGDTAKKVVTIRRFLAAYPNHPRATRYARELP